MMETRNSGTTPRRIVVVGNGMVGHRFCQLLADAGVPQSDTVVVFGEEPRRAYDRVHLSEYFANEDADALALCPPGWYDNAGIALYVGRAVRHIDRSRRVVIDADGRETAYDVLVLATGSSCFIPPVPGIEKPGVLPYRTLGDLDAIKHRARNATRAAVLGGGLLGLEAAKAAMDLGLETTIVELAPRLMPRQLDTAGAAVLERYVTDLGIRVMTGRSTQAVEGGAAIEALAFADGGRLDTDMLIVSAGIRPRDELGRAAQLVVGARGGIVVDDAMFTSDPAVAAIGEVALFDGQIYGLVAPGYAMAEVLAGRLTGQQTTFAPPDVATRLKLLGVDMATFGDPFASGGDVDTITFQDFRRGLYKRVNIARDADIVLGGMLVGDVSQHAHLMHMVESRTPVPDPAESLVVGGGEMSGGPDALPDSAQICSCESVAKGAICDAVREGELCTIGQIKACTKAGTGCGGCVPMITSLLKNEMEKAGRAVSTHLCEHFAYSRRDLFEIVKINRIKSFDELVASHGTGSGCEICKPTVASILASLWNQHIVDHAMIQDTNDRFLANIQRGGTYSVIPRVPGGEIQPRQLVALGQVAEDYDLYTKITGGQRVALFGARVEQLPEIWEKLIGAGFESGHAYGKALRTVKSCVGTDWCRFGVGDSCGLAIRVEKRYRGLRAPHKIKMAVSGCIRECAEARGKDVGLIAVEGGWNLYVCGNGGANPRHADLLAEAIDDETAIAFIDRFLMYYIHTADKLTRTSAWLDKLEGGIDHLRQVVMHDSLGICQSLEADMERVVDTYACEWRSVVEDPEKRRLFTHFADEPEGDDSLNFVDVRGQRRPAPWVDGTVTLVEALSVEAGTSWVRVARVNDVPRNGGTTVRYGPSQIALFHFASKDQWYATQNLCPHRRDMVLARGLIGDAEGLAKVACPMHKRQFALDDGRALTGGESIRTFPVWVDGDDVYLELPPIEELARDPMMVGDGRSEACTSRA